MIVPLQSGGENVPIISDSSKIIRASSGLIIVGNGYKSMDTGIFIFYKIEFL